MEDHRRPSSLQNIYRASGYYRSASACTNYDYQRRRNDSKYDRNPVGWNVDIGDGDIGMGHSERTDNTAHV